MKAKSIIDWLPGIITELAAGIFCIIYWAMGGKLWTPYVEMTVSALLPFLFPIYGLISKKRLPVILGVLSGIFVFMSCNLGSALGFYDKISYWDLILHGLFGFLCSLTVFVFLLRWNGDKLNPIGFMIIVFMFTMGVAALWEVWEYMADVVIGGDSQGVWESFADGKSPVADTMEDMMIAMAGSAVFYITLLIDKFTHHKIYKPICGFSGFVKQN